MKLNKVLFDILASLESKDHEEVMKSVENYPHAYLLFNSVMCEYIDSIGKMGEYVDYFNERTKNLNEDYSDAKFYYQGKETEEVNDLDYLFTGEGSDEKNRA